MTSEFRVPRRRWGRSNIKIPVIPFGTQGFGNHFGFVSDDGACELIRRAVDIGVNHFDCARCYGDSLRKLGVAIKTGVIKRSEVIISGRVCCHGREEIDYSAEHAVSDVEEQLEILGMDYFDAAFIHDPMQVEPTLAKDGTLAGLLKAKSRGLTRNVGYGMRPHDFHLKAIETGDVDVLLTFNDYNLLRQTAADDILPAAAAKDMGILNGWSIKQGILTGIDLSSRDKNNDVARAIKMRQWCMDEDISLLAVALQFCLREERIHGNPIGSLNIEQLEMNARAVSEPLPPTALERFAAQNF